MGDGPFDPDGPAVGFPVALVYVGAVMTRQNHFNRK